MKRILSLVLALVLIVTLFSGVPTANAAKISFTDIPEKHWARKQIEYLSYKEVLVGDGSGKFRPDDTVTRAEFITMLVKLFGLRETKDVSFTNVPKWALETVQKAAAQGFLLDYPADVNFNDKLTREEAIALLMRYLAYENEGNPLFTPVEDYYEISTAYRDYVVQAVSLGIISGFDDGTFRPKNVLTRAQALTILYYAAGAVYDASAYADSPGANNKNAVITGTASLYNLNLSGRILITEDVGAVNFINCTVTGEIIVRGDTIVTFNNMSAPSIEFTAADGQLILLEKSTIKTANILATTTIEIDETGTIETLNIAKEAKNTKANGKGTIKKINVYAEGVDTGKIMPKEYYIDKDLTAKFAGIEFKSGVGTSDIAGFKSAFVSGNVTHASPSDFFPTGSSSVPTESEIIITFIPNTDGYAFAGAWPNDKTALNGEEIFENANTYGGYPASGRKVKAGEVYTLTITVDGKYTDYNCGLVLVTNIASPLPHIYKPVYNQDEIGRIASAMGTELPGAPLTEAPEWYAELSTDGKSIVLVFDQVIYVDSGDGKLVKLSKLSSKALTSAFAIETTPADTASKYPKFKVDVYEGPVTIVYLTPTEGVKAGEYYYIYPMTPLYNADGVKCELLYDHVYVK